ncbi:restriction endonuclease subunit S [Thalassolituus sp.]|jgi:type I restriction enzyme S subunit|uniref:restriction endonuclease subunit S n=1 Tax=Thalassolituus sp. TaxID=2030822 RepID=UPI0032D8FBD4
MSNKHAVKEAPASYQSTPAPLGSRELQSFITGNPLTENLNLWISATKAKSTSGRGSNKKIELVGIKKLRELILELAVRGKLVPQNPEDEPASELLKKIDAEKAKLLAEGKIKKQKKLPEISEDEKPFELPNGWSILKLGSISEINGGFAFKSSNYSSSGIRVIRISDFDEKGFKYDNVVKHEYSENLDSFLLSENCILMAMTGGTVGKSLLVRALSETMVVNQRVATIKILESVLPDYIYSLIQTPLIQRVIDEAKNSTNDNISMSDINNFLVPLPPLAEQYRIVAKVNELMALCDQLEQHSVHQLDAHKQLVEILLATLVESENADELATNWQRLAEHFDTLFSGALTSTTGVASGGGEWAIDRLKDTILQLAVMGKLVPQNPEDEPASELLKKIEAEKAKLLAEGKIKKQKKLPEISEDEKPFELPNGWSILKLGSISEINGGFAFKSSNYSSSGIRVIRISDFDEKGFKYDNVVKHEYSENLDSFLLSENCILMAMTGGTVGKSLLVRALSETMVVNQRVATIKILESVLPDYIYSLIQTPLIQRVIDEAKNSTNDNISMSDINNFLVPLPPLAEQYRIVAKVNELMALCDQLKTRLQAASETQLTLTEALVEQALQ